MRLEPREVLPAQLTVDKGVSHLAITGVRAEER
jgi:hypothetical protein